MTKDLDKVLGDWFTAWNSHNTQQVIEFYTVDSVFEDIPHRIFCTNKEDLFKAIDRMFIGIHDIKIEQKNTLISGKLVCSECIFSGKQMVNTGGPNKPITEKRFSVPVVYISEWHDNKIKRHTIYHDQLSVMQQLGLISSMPYAGENV
jgi:ketosteroid isomerase-like protein